MTATQKAKSEAIAAKSSGSENEQARLEEQLADSFPASDPPSVTQPGIRAGGPDRPPTARKSSAFPPE
jgi:hypothetical protein